MGVWCRLLGCYGRECESACVFVASLVLTVLMSQWALVQGLSSSAPLEASFFGESYILIPLQEANNSTSISLEFKSYQPQSLLLLAAGDTDYVIVQLNAGIVETRINLGSGEAVAFSARGVRLDDSNWHLIVINRSVDTVSLEVDGRLQGQATTPGTYYDLNIDLGILLGGSDHLNKPFYKSLKSFRGCLRNVFYNGRNILEDAKSARSSHNTFQVSWQCEAEFSATLDSPVTFRHETSFMAFPYLRVSAEASGVFSCYLKTRSLNAIVLFNSGAGTTWEDFIAVELVNGKPKLSINKGSGVVEVVLDLAVNDGRWHKVEVTVSESVVVLEVDSEKNLTRFHLGTQNTLNLANHLYIGGLGIKARASAIKLGLATLQADPMKGSMLGCIRDVKMNSRSFGLHQIQISRLIGVGCSWEYPCSQNPCVANAACTELEGSDFRCDCGQADCVREQFKSRLEERNGDLNGLLSVGKLEVVEGASVAIDTKVIKVRQEYFSDSLREENVVFTVKKAPQMGVIEVGNRRGSQPTFTLRDLKNGLVYYRHYRGNLKLDSITLEMSLAAQPVEGESKVKDRYDFVLPVNILPQTRSKLEVNLQSGNVLNITSGAKIRITPSVINVKTLDLDPSKLRFCILYLRQSASMFERSNQPKVSVMNFTLQEVQDGVIWFQHKGDKMVYTKVNVSDGVSVSDAVDLRFKEETLSIQVVNNTGFSVSYGTGAIISPWNLSSTVNVKLEDLELRYQVVRPPAHGSIQRLEYETSEWVDVNTFTQRHIDTGRLRYQHLPGPSISSYDSFQFDVRSKDIKTNIQTVNVIFKTVTVTIEQNEKLVLHQAPFGKYTDSILKVVSSADVINEKNIVYSVLRPPQRGSLYLIQRSLSHINLFDSMPALKTDGTFTQQDVRDGFVYYKLERPAFDKVDDFTDLQASYFGFNVMVRSMIQFSPEKTPVRFVNNGLANVLEGGSSVISRQELYLEMDNFRRFSFSVLRFPDHGWVNIVDPESLQVVQRNVSSFTMTDIKEGKVVYQHDDSESKEDSFTFTAAPILDESEDNTLGEIQEYTSTFHIRMKMKNDNPPVRVFPKVFQVAIGQAKHLTINDLAFMDPDLDFDETTLFYQRQNIPNGEILNSATEEVVYNFTQGDLVSGALLFQHKGENYARTQILVTDGIFFSTSLFEIQASAPFIRVSNNTGVEVRQNRFVSITTEHLSVETNLDFKPDDILFQLMDEPKYGIIRVRGQQSTRFTLQDLLSERVVYWHNGGSAIEDPLLLTAQLGQVKTQINFSVRIIADGLSDPPEIIHNRILKVISGQAEVLSSSYLQVSHQNYKPSEVEFIVTQLPQHGHLVIKGRSIRAGSAPEFTQQDIDNDLISYTSDSSVQLADKFMFDVGTDLQSLRRLEFLIEIIPPVRQVMQVNVNAVEGGSVTLTDRHLHLRGRLPQGKNINFLVQSPPVHGKIINKIDKKHSQLSSFSSDDLTQGQVTYSHDGSESLQDEFSLVDDETRQVYHILINVTAVNDQPPIVTVNTGLDVWSGSVTLLTNKHLQVSDLDSSSDEVEFHVTTPTNGHLAFLNNTFKQISKFTQSDVDVGRVVFVHKGSEQGEFSFQATDGSNMDKSRLFNIRARPVVISLLVNKTLKAFPYTPQPITNTSLLAVSASNFTSPIIFTVVEPKPEKGRLVTMVGRRTQEVFSFTQDEINQGLVFFLSNTSLRHWKEAELMYFEITTTYAQPLMKQAFEIEISYWNINDGNYRKLLNMNTPTVEEGKQVTVTRSHFDSTQLVQRIRSLRSNVNVVFTFESKAQHGYLWFKDKSVEVGEEFTQEDLNNGALVYKHDHSDSLEDYFRFAVKLLVPRAQTEAPQSMARVFNFTVTIEPINDQGFELVTRYPRIMVTQGQEMIVTSHNLTTVDLDTGPEGIEYTILTQPKNGMLVKLGGHGIRLQKFTQEEINKGLILFKHDGSRATSGSLSFQVWDGKFEPRQGTMEITVIPITIQASKDRHVPLVQGQNYVAISNKHLMVSTNGDMAALTYKVSQAPQFGRLVKQSVRVSAFTQTDVDTGQLFYMQDDDSPGDDFFVCDIQYQGLECFLNTVQVEIIIKPRIKQGPLIASPGSYVAITRSSLDASELAQMTSDNPRFTVLEPPKFGQIMRRHRQRRQATMENSFQPVSNFTFEDVVYTKIYYVPTMSTADRNGKSDQFTFTLSAKGVPPAKGEFLIQLDPPDVTTDNKATSTSTSDQPGNDAVDSGNSGDSEEDGLVSSSLDSDAIEDDSVIVVAIVVSLVLIIIIIVIVILVFFYLRRRRHASAQEVKPVKPRPYISGPLQLEQPHVQIEPKNSSLASPGSADDAALVPRCHDEDQFANSSHVDTSSEHYSLFPLTNQASPSQSPDVTRVDYSHPTRSSKVTPLLDSQSDEVSVDTDRRSTVTSGRGSDASVDLLDWTLMDPDLLQQCKITTPVLRNNQYWL